MTEMQKHFIQLLSSLIGVMIFLILLSLVLANRLEAAEAGVPPQNGNQLVILIHSPALGSPLG